MSNMVEIDIDFGYCGEVEMVLAHDECGEHDDVEFYRNDLLAAENAKLRELLRNALTYIGYVGCGVECPETGSSATLTPCDTCDLYETENCAYVMAQSARELGIEVTDA